FGGVIPMAAGWGGADGGPLKQPWLRQRLSERFSVAFLTGETDFNRGDVELYCGPFLTALGGRTRVWPCPGLGHDMPNGEELIEGVRWLDPGAEQRRQLAQRYPAMRVPGNSAPSREEAAEALLTEARERLGNRETQYSGMMQLRGCSVRWDGLPQA